MSTYAGSCYVVDASGGYTITQTNPKVNLIDSTPLAYYDISNAIQIRMGVRTFNSLIGITKDEDNVEIIESLYDVSNDELETDTLVLSTTDFKNNLLSSNIISMGDMSTLYSDFNYTVTEYFGSSSCGGSSCGFASLFAEESASNLNNGVFDVSGLYNIIHGQNYDVQGAVVSDLSGSLTVYNINEILRYMVDTNIFDNRPVSSNYGVQHGFIENDLIYLRDGLTITLTVDIEAETLTPINNVGPTNLSAIDSLINYTNTTTNVKKTTTSTTTNITQTYQVPVLLILQTEDTFSYSNYGMDWTDVTGDVIGDRFWLACSLSTSGQYQSIIDLSGDIYTSSDYGSAWTYRYNIGNSVANQIALSTSGQYQTACSGTSIFISSNYGVNWTETLSVGQTQIFVSISLNGEYQTLISVGDSMYQSTDYGATWTRYDDDTTDLYNSIQTFPTGGVAMSYNGQYQTIVSEAIYLSSDYGSTWTTTSVDTSNVSFDDHNWMDVDVSSTGEYQAAVEVTGEIYISSDYGATWSARNDSHITDRQWQGISMSASGAFLTALAKGGNVFVSIDYGVSWTKSTDTQLENKQWQDIEVSSNGIYQSAVVYGGSVYISTLL